MWRYPVLNLCFIVLVITLLAIQHSVGTFGPTGATWHHYARVFKAPPAFRGPANIARAAASVTDFWRRGLIFKEWSMEYQTSQWEIFNASSPAESDLLEARFHVANAEVFTDAVSDKNRALEELARAEKSLQAARTIVKTKLDPQLAMLKEQLTAAEIKEQSENAISTVQFEMIKSDLDHLIERLRLLKT